MGKAVVPTNKIQGDSQKVFTKFKNIWENTPEDIREILSAGLYILSRKPGEIIEGLQDARFALSPEKTELLKMMATYTTME